MCDPVLNSAVFNAVKSLIENNIKKEEEIVEFIKKLSREYKLRAIDPTPANEAKKRWNSKNKDKVLNYSKNANQRRKEREINNMLITRL